MSSCGREALALAAAGRTDEAVALIAAHVARGDAEALFVRGLWRLEGRIVAPDHAGAREDLRRAADAGNAGAARILPSLLATGIGGARDWPASLTTMRRMAADPFVERQLALVERMALDSDGEPTQLAEAQVLRADPSIRLVRGLFSSAECALLIALAAARFKPALIFHEAQQKFVRDALRDSETASFPIVSETPFVHALNRRLAAVTGTDAACGETLQVLKYAAGQQYRPHLDAIPALANQRVLTALVYLNEDYAGGETRFLDLNVDVRGRTGDALIFANALPDGRPDARTRHAGLPVTAGTKYAASRWIRQQPPADPTRGFGRHEAETRLG